MKSKFLFQILLVSIFNLFGIQNIHSQTKKKVLFIGNSYVATNNLPTMLATLALSTGDTIIHDSNTPGGQTFMGHSSNATTLSKIQQGNWDYVVLQEQSQYPSFPISQVNNSVFPYAKKLDSLVHVFNPCAKTIFYMTWGRKNGDAQNCPFYTPVCTYEGMDNLLRERYMMMAEQNSAMVSPVGAIWRYIRTNHPEIELYSSDESHPSVAGTYAAACGFYASILRKDPTLITATSGLTQEVAVKIKNAARLVVLDSLATWKINAYDPSAAFTYDMVNNIVSFSNNSLNAVSYSWNFGDGTTSTEENPSHNYTATGTYSVELTATTCNDISTSIQTIQIASLSTAEVNPLSQLALFPNPTNDHITIDGHYQALKLMDALGRVLFTTDYISTLDLRSFASGTYYIVLEQEGFTVTKQIVKN